MKLPLAIAAILFNLPAMVICRPENEELSSQQSSSLRASRRTENDGTPERELSILHDGRDAHGRILLTHNHRKLGKIDVSNVASAQAGAKSILEGSLDFDAGAGVGDKFVPKNKNKNHLRFAQVHQGMEIQGANLVVHADEDGNVYGVNGEHVPTSKLPLSPTIRPGLAMRAALRKSRVPRSEYSQCTEPELTVVRNPEDGSGHLAWTCTYRYNMEQVDGSMKPFKDKVFAEAAGKPGLVALFPQISTSSYSKPKRVKASSIHQNEETQISKEKSKLHDDERQRKMQQYTPPDMVTRDCKEATRNCNTVSTSSNNINTDDLALNSAHNYAIATYNYYWNNHGRWSIDDDGMTLISRVHFDENYSNAFWDGSQMTYGDGDGNTFAPLSQDADVVAHELTHGVTERSSGLIYQGESGALNEAWSDIFGALVDRQEGAEGSDLWVVGEDIYTPNRPNDGGIRDMADPQKENHPDYWPDRYQGSSDNGGVHWNSGIANLAFALLVGMAKQSNGNNINKHPRGKSSIIVPIISWEEAADSFYLANVACLTPASNFAAARYCTADVHGGTNSAAIHAAWDAVAVPNDPPPPPPAPITLNPNGDNGGILTGLSASTGSTQRFLLPSETIYRGSRVTCITTGSNGDADLYLAFNADPQPNSYSTSNECTSTSPNSMEECTTSKASEDGTQFVALIHAYSGYSNLGIECSETRNCAGPGTFPCGKCCNGCSEPKPGSGNLPGSRVCL